MSYELLIPPVLDGEGGTSQPKLRLEVRKSVGQRAPGYCRRNVSSQPQSRRRRGDKVRRKVSDIPNEEDITPLGGRQSIYSAPKWSGGGSEGVEGERASNNASKRRPLRR